MPQPNFKICSVKEIDSKDEGVIRFTLTQRIVDRDSEVIEPKGIKADNFKKNPVFLWAHQSGGFFRQAIPPIGKVLMDTMEITDDYVDADVEFDMEDPFAKMIYMKFKNKFLNAGSVGFMPLAWDKEPVLPGQKGYTITKWELFEFSAVPVPANPAALAKSFTDEELKDEKTKLWHEALKDFIGDDNFDNTPEGWVDKINIIEQPEIDPNIETRTATTYPDTDGSDDKIEFDQEVPVSTLKDWIEDVLIQMNNTGAVPHREDLKFEENHPFAYESAVERVRVWASADGSGDEYKIDWSKFRRAFAWFDPKDPKSVKAYKFLHHDIDITTGHLKTVWRGVAGSMILFLGAKGSIDVPDEEKSAVYNHLARHYGEFDKSAPSFKTYTDEEMVEFEPETEVSEQDLQLIAKKVIQLLKEKSVI